MMRWIDVGPEVAMGLRGNPGPVFLCESIAASRRRLGYALRAVLVLAMLLAMWVAWLSLRQRTPLNAVSAARFMAELGEQIYFGIAGVQLSLVLLAAPAATAGSVCVDRGRGWLAHLFATPLSDTEIVLGKLGIGIASAMGLVLAGLPVLALSMLLGGVIPEALVILTVVSLAVSVMGCAVAFGLSVRASRTHEVLMVAIAAWPSWLLAAPLWTEAARPLGLGGPPAWFIKLNPFALVYAPYVWPGYVSPGDVAIFVAACMLIAAGAVVLATRDLRREVPARGERSGRLESLRRWARASLFSWWPSPSLDGNPVLWREWHRNRPSRMGRVVTILYIAVTSIAVVLGVLDAARRGVGPGGSSLLFGTNLYAVWAGLLLASATTPTVLTEERARASLDVLLSTPLPTHAIVLGKWWACYRRLLPLLILPALTGLFLAVAMPENPLFAFRGLRNRAVPITTGDRVMAGILPSLFVMAHAAVVTSLGLALATWLKRTGLAVAASVGAFVVGSIGGIVAVAVVRSLADWWSDQVATLNISTKLLIERATMALNPLGGQTVPFDLLMDVFHLNHAQVWQALLADLAILTLAAAGLLGLTLLTLNRCLGRMDETPGLLARLKASRDFRRVPLRPATAGER
jgi:hypothetical protein